MKRRLVQWVLVAAVVSAACASGSSGADVATSDLTDSTDTSVGTSTDTPTTTDAGTAPDAGDATAAVTQSEDTTSMSASSPIGAFFDGGFDEAIAEYTVRVEEAILLCMAAQGFEFAVSEGGRQNEVELRQNELTVREWTAEYGFGISTSFDSFAQDQTSDPNTAIFFGMSESEREIWLETLSGGELPSANGDFGSRPLEDQGCIGQALIDTGGQEAIEGLSEFGDIYDEGEQAIYDRREMVEAIDTWARCMSEAGYNNYSALDDPEDDISARLEVVTAPMSAAIDNLSDEEGQALIAGESLDIADLPGLDVDALRELQNEERALALADLDCYDAEVKATFEPLRDEFEQGLLTEYSTEFDELKNIGG